MAGPIVVLGPQRPTPNLRRALDTLQVEGPVALITAGWRHDEDEIEPITAHVGREVRHLRLYRAMEQILALEPLLNEAYRARQRRIVAYKDVYRISLRAASTAVRELEPHVETDPELYGPDLDDAFTALRLVDKRLLGRLDVLHAAHPEVAEPWRTHPVVADSKERALEKLDGVGAVLIAGGHVAVLRNRLRFFGLHAVIRELHQRGVPLFVWSAAAMVLSDLVVLFYDHPPEGHGEAEVLARGFKLLPDNLFLPHARLRLDLDDADRVGILARRFRKWRCLGVEPGAWLTWADGAWTDRSLPGSLFQLNVDGTVTDPDFEGGR